MCILFLYTSDTPGPNKYRLILASNRDEYYKRPAKGAHFWAPEFPNIIGGQDMEPGRAGGTWLAMNKNGKVAALLNILTSTVFANKLGRGFLVNGFLSDEEVSGLDYCRTLKDDAEKYNPFILVTIELKQPKANGPALTYYTNHPEAMAEYPIQLSGEDTDDGKFYAFGNSLPESPFKKVKHGKAKLKEILHRFPDKTMETELVEALLGLLRSKESFHPDPQILKQAPEYPPELTKGMASKFVDVPSEAYGSRTQTVILIDENEVVKYHEWTMEEPIDPHAPTWIHSSFQFHLH